MIKYHEIIFKLTITDYNGFVLSIAGEKVVTDVTANDGLWHFICTTWTSAGGRWTVFKDGILADFGQKLSAGSRIRGGGQIVIGQEQDEEGGKFSAAESFHGRLTRLDVWSRILDPGEVAGLNKQCEPYYGDLLAWSHVYTGLKGHIKVSGVQTGNNQTYGTPVPSSIKYKIVGLYRVSQKKCSLVFKDS